MPPKEAASRLGYGLKTLLTVCAQEMAVDRPAGDAAMDAYRQRTRREIGLSKGGATYSRRVPEEQTVAEVSRTRTKRKA